MPHTDLIIDNELWPSVTQVIGILSKPQLNKWREFKGTKEADRISKEAADRGRRLHEIVETFLKGENVTFCGEEKDLRPIFEAWFKWWNESGYQCVAQELKVISKKHKYGGTFDSIISDGDDKVLVDWKFSSNSDHFRWLQLAGYALALFEHTGQKIKRGMVVRVDKKGKVHISEKKNLWMFVPLFIACRRLWDFVNQKGKFEKQ